MAVGSRPDVHRDPFSGRLRCSVSMRGDLFLMPLYEEAECRPVLMAREVPVVKHQRHDSLSLSARRDRHAGAKFRTY
jgi:hypothetical protein